MNFFAAHHRKIAYDKLDVNNYDRRQYCPFDLLHVLAISLGLDFIYTLRLLNINYENSTTTEIDTLPLICNKTCGQS